MVHRDKLLNEFGYEIPAKTENSTETQKLTMILRGLGVSNNSNRHYLLHYPICFISTLKVIQGLLQILILFQTIY